MVAYVPLFEGWRLPVVEAMRAGVPVVASAVPSSGGAAVHVDPLDVESVADGLVRVAVDDEARAERIRAGLRRAASMRWEDAARRHVELWEALAEG